MTTRTMNTDLPNLISRALECFSVPKGELLTAALSGGSDSVAMLLALCEIGGYEIRALHVHHGLRQNADGDEEFCRELCKTLGIPLTVDRVTVPHTASPEAAARQARYNAFAEYLSDHGGFILTAHHLEDQAETFLMNVARGSGNKGLCGIPARRGNVLRPMLDADKTVILSYLAEKGARWREDESNDDDRMTRNFLRRHVMPLLYEREDLRFLTGFQKTVYTLREEQEYLDSVAASYRQENNAVKLFSLPRPICWRVLKERCPPLTREQFDRILTVCQDGKDRKEQLSGCFLIIRDGVLFFTDDEPSAPLPDPVPLRDKACWQEKNVFINYFTEIHTPFTNLMADCDKIAGGKLFVRSRRPGDRITLQDRKVTKTLKKLFSEDHVSDRDRRVVIADGKDRVVFAEGYGVSLPFAPDENTEKYFEIKITQENENENRKRR